VRRLYPEPNSSYADARGVEVAKLRKLHSIKDEAGELIDSLPDRATWQDVVRTVFERLVIEEGIADLEGRRVWTSDDIRRRLEMPLSGSFWSVRALNTAARIPWAYLG